MVLSGCGRYALDQFARGRYAAEPAVDAAEIAQRSGSFEGRAIGGVEDFLRVNALHVNESHRFVILSNARNLLFADASKKQVPRAKKRRSE